MKFFNSLSKKTEIFTITNSHVNIYSCGPTVYDYAHIGNIRTFLFEDLLIRTLKDTGYSVDHTRNITDVDDKTIKNALSLNTSLKEFTQIYTKAFFEDIQQLSFDQTNTTYLYATEYISHMIELIQELIKTQHAYETPDGVYFKVSSFSQYGNFAGLDLENMLDGASGSNIEFDKEEIGDFVLWKKHKPSDGEIFWESPWGKGRPGWHTECAAMVKHKYPNGLDIHTGGGDLLFPHHTNEKAHCECLSNKSMSRFWLHAAHLLVDNKKMSKSLGNFYTIRDLIQQGFSYSTIRFYLQTGAHYRSSLNFTLEGLKAAENALKRVNNFIYELQQKPQEGEYYPLKQEFDQYLHDDLNISGALGVVFTVINDFYNGAHYDSKHILNELRKINAILSVFEFSQSQELDGITLELFNQRIKAREEKNWQESDRLRDELLTHGVEIRDTKEGTTFRIIN